MGAPPKNLDESLKNIAWMAAEIERATGIPCKTADELAVMRADILAEIPENRVLWIFGYGSLIWNPMFEFAESRVAKLPGYARSFCIKVPVNRGTPENPGLMLALVEGDACDGVAFRIGAAKIEETLELLWVRELLAGVYLPKLLPIAFEGGTATALVFIANPNHPRHMRPDTETSARMIAAAEGSLGPNRDYLFELKKKLDELGIEDKPMDDLYAAVKSLRHD